MKLHAVNLICLASKIYFFALLREIQFFVKPRKAINIFCQKVVKQKASRLNDNEYVYKYILPKYTKKDM